MADVISAATENRFVSRRRQQQQPFSRDVVVITGGFAVNEPIIGIKMQIQIIGLLY